MKHLVLYENHGSSSGPLLYVTLDTQLSGPDYANTLLNIFKADNDIQAKDAYLDIYDMSRVNLHNEESYNITHGISSDFIDAVMTDNYFAGAGWDATGFLVGKYSALPNWKYPGSHVIIVLASEEDGTEFDDNKEEALGELAGIFGPVIANEILYKAEHDISAEANIQTHLKSTWSSLSSEEKASLYHLHPSLTPEEKAQQETLAKKLNFYNSIKNMI